MKKITNKIASIMTLAIVTVFSMYTISFANIEISGLEYSQEYKEYQALSEEEKQKVIMPRMYDNPIKQSNADYLKGLGNTFKITQLLKSSLTSQYNLKNEIPDNTTIKNQASTNGCWAFAVLGSLESNLAMQNKQKGNPVKIYDFSERHLVYGTARKAFLNDLINEYGYTKEIGGGNSFLGNAYLTNGMGAIAETEMPFENNEEKIEISKIQNKTVLTELVDSEFFASPKDNDEKEIIKQKVKEHITNYGGVTANIYGATILSEYYNNTTGAIYCDNKENCPQNHAVLIIGWDDGYSKEKFNEKHKPTTDGAWIVKNSWGEKQQASLTQLKEELFETNRQVCDSQGWHSASEIPDKIIIEVLEKAGYAKEDMTISGDTISIKIGDNGYMYISYEDVNVFSSMYGIINATDGKEYDHIYQYDALGCNKVITINKKVGYLANVFERNSTDNEVLTKIGVNTLIDIEKCTVLVNPNGSSKKLEDLQEVKLAKGDYETLRAGYNTIEFANPIKLNGESFVVVLKVEDDMIYIPIVNNTATYWADVELKSGKSFVTTEDDIENNIWIDMATSSQISEENRGNITLKAFTIDKEEALLDSIEITKAPDTTTYRVGENFVTTGMKVVANYTDGTKNEITNYKVTNGENLQENQTTVTITYTEKEITKTAYQTIQVEKPIATITKIEIKTMPSKLEYTKDVDELNLIGGVILATYSDATTEEISMTNPIVTVTGYDKTKLGTQTITVSYKGQKTTFEITVKEEKTPEVDKTKEEPTPSNFEQAKANITKACSYVYINKDKTEYTTMTIDISGIKLGDNKSSREYYYYISGKQGETNIKEEDWKKLESIEQESNGTYHIVVELDSRTQKNIDNIKDSDNLYIYIKEKSTLSESTVTVVNTMKTNMQTETEIYIDDVKKDSIKDVTDNNYTDKNTNEKNDTTVVGGTIPQTGQSIVIIIGIATIAIIIVGIYIKLRKMKDIK